MTLIGLILALVVIGLVLWLIKNFLPIEPRIYNLIVAVVIIIVVIWLISALLGVGILNQPIRLR